MSGTAGGQRSRGVRASWGRGRGWDGAGSGIGESEGTADRALVVTVRPARGDGSLNKDQGQGHWVGSERTVDRIAGDQGSRWVVQRHQINSRWTRWCQKTQEVRRGARDPWTVGHERHPQVPASPYLHMVGPQHDPAAEAIAQIDDGHTAAEAHDAGQGHPQRGDEDLWREEWGGGQCGHTHNTGQLG